MLKEGDIFEINPGDKVYTEIPQHFIYENREGVWDLDETDVIAKGQWLYLSGNYVVTKTTIDGGGTGHGPHDIYPDGHHVWAEKISNPLVKINFYQSGSFTVMHPDKKAIGRAKIKWIVEE